MTQSKFEGPKWDLSTEYTSFESKEFKGDLNTVKQYIEKINILSAELEKNPIQAAQQIIVLQEIAQTLLYNINTYTSCVLSVDGTHNEAKKMSADIGEIEIKLSQALLSFQRFIKTSDQNIIEEVCSLKETAGFRFQAQKLQFWKDYQLSHEEESLIKTLELDGFHAWSKLYDNFSVKLKCEIDLHGQKKDLAFTEAITGLYSSIETERKASYLGLEKAWHTQEESCAAILNSLAGFRLKIIEKRSKIKKLHYIDPVTHSSNITGKSLGSLICALEKNNSLGQKANKILSTVIKKEKMDPWDFLAQAPAYFEQRESRVTFSDAIDMIEKCFTETNTKMGEFVRFAYNKNWIEGSHAPKKRAGGYCTKFAKSKEPRIFMTYDGSMGNVSTLAHELGHAYHSWIMRDLPFFEKKYPMTLAETASIFSESLLFEELLKTTQSKQEKLNLIWEDLSNIVAFLVDIPNRYAFEKEFYDRKENGEYLGVDAITEINNKSFMKWYGNTLSEPHSFFWMSKLHFYISQVSFYNFPYSFGYLFGLKVFAKKIELKDKFHDFYVALLRDTGRMSAEEVVKKHFSENLEDPHFWDSSMEIVQAKIKRAESFLSELGF